MGRVSLQYPDGPNVITKVLIRGRQEAFESVEKAMG